MKYLISALLILSSVLTQSQTFDKSIDKLFFKEMNVYRVSKGLPPLNWDDNLYKMSKFHSTYQVKTKIITHTQVEEVEGMKLLPNIGDRFHYFLPNTLMNWCGENVQGGQKTIVINDTTCFGKFVKSTFNYSLRDLEVNHIVALYELYKWVISPTHNANLLATDCKTGAYALGATTIDYFEKSLFHQGQPSIRLKGASTMNLAR